MLISKINSQLQSVTTQRFPTLSKSSEIKSEVEFKKSSNENLKNISFKALLFENKLQTTEKFYIKNLIDNYKEDNEQISLLGKGTFGTVYKIKLKNRGEVAVKILSPENKTQLYGGGNLEKEAEILKNIPKSCTRTQQLVDHFKISDQNYLVSSLIRGKPMSGITNLSPKLLNNISDELFMYDSNNLMFFDLNPNNILVENDTPGFIDFEFMMYKNQNQNDFDAINDFHHINRNIYHPQKSNINSFENRCLGSYIRNTETSKGQHAANELVKNYLKSLSLYHSKMATFYENSKDKFGSEISPKAIAYEKILANLYKNPCNEIVEIEKDFINLRYTTINYHLYVKRKNANKLIDGDKETYGNFDEYIEKMTTLARNIETNISSLAQKNKTPEIQNYCKVNKLFIENFLRKNANKNYYAMRNNKALKELESLQKEIIKEAKSNLLDEKIKVFEKCYTNLKIENKNNLEFLKFCDDIKFVAENTTNFIKKEQI